MSFSSDVKRELCKIESEPSNLRKAELYGLLLCGHQFSARGIVLQTENAAVSDRAAVLLAQEAGVVAEKTIPLSRRGKGGGFFTVSVTNPDDRLSLLRQFGHSPSEPHIKINRANLEEEAYAAAFLRGALLACGTVSDPQKGYRLEFVLSRFHLSNGFAALLGECCGGAFHPKVGTRGGSYVVYLKNSEEIADLLTYLGAPNSAMFFMQVKMVKELRNDLNRKTNFDTANIDKIAAAAAGQIEAVCKLEERGLLCRLPEDLQQLAGLRMDHPELSLRELGQMLSPPVSRSGVNRRLKKLIELAEEIK